RGNVTPNHRTNRNNTSWLTGMDSNIHTFFFFQAEAGIRDNLVTGVQTCALPILPGAGPRLAPRRVGEVFTGQMPHRRAGDVAMRSEERRVGKECSSLWRRNHYKTIRRGVVRPHHESSLNIIEP